MCFRPGQLGELPQVTAHVETACAGTRATSTCRTLLRGQLEKRSFQRDIACCLDIQIDSHFQCQNLNNPTSELIQLPLVTSCISQHSVTSLQGSPLTTENRSEPERPGLAQCRAVPIVERRITQEWRDSSQGHVDLYSGAQATEPCATPPVPRSGEPACHTCHSARTLLKNIALATNRPG